MDAFELSSLKRGSHVHFIGIGGISMSGLAAILLDKGFTVSGSDMNASPITDHLKELGATIYIGQRASNIHCPDAVVYSAAIHADNEEFIAAQASCPVVMDRATLLGAIMKLYPYPIAVSGTHGKTTTTAMLTHIELAADLSPTVSIGGELPAIQGNVRVGSGAHFICEACEYHQSFLRFFPLVSIILNIEADHLDYFRDLEHIKETFRALAELTPSTGAVIINKDDKNTCDAMEGVAKNMITCSRIGDADYVAKNISAEDGCPSFEVWEHGECLGQVALSVHGMHNVSNALCAIAAARFVGVGFPAIQQGLLDFRCVGRRFEEKGTAAGVTVIDDYAHHPTEIAATLRVAASTAKGRIWSVFQPHTYTRTKTLFPQFVSALSGADPFILDIYAAREKDTGLVSAAQLAEAIPGATYMRSFADCAAYILEHAKPGDMLLTMGAGDVNKVGLLFLDMAAGKNQKNLQKSLHL
ncbi:MAG: UDP-N-acetylmuramate--L-alanine ligase [Clostridia bacterium]|nr:UDP-N-acetylmuramate--L-alanine ligase [Clostridia bacterium]